MSMEEFTDKDLKDIKGVRYQNNIDGSWISEKIIDKDGKDITDKVREAEDFLLKIAFN